MGQSLSLFQLTRLRKAALGALPWIEGAVSAVEEVLSETGIIAMGTARKNTGR